MNAYSEYSEQLSQKLAQFPVPDMADVVWAEINNALANKIEEAIKKRRPKQVNNYRMVAVAIISTCILLMLILVMSKHRKSKSPGPSQNHTPQKSTIPHFDNPELIEKNNTQLGKKMVATEKKRTIRPPGDKRKASVVVIPATTVHSDIKFNAISMHLLFKKQIVLDSGRPGKLIGVKGVHDSNYEIHFARDSTRKK